MTVAYVLNVKQSSLPTVKTERNTDHLKTLKILKYGYAQGTITQKLCIALNPALVYWLHV